MCEICASLTDALSRAKRLLEQVLDDQFQVAVREYIVELQQNLETSKQACGSD